MEPCKYYTPTVERISKLETKVKSVCKDTDSNAGAIKEVEERVVEHIREVKDDLNKRIDDKMSRIQQLFAAIMVMLLGGSISFAALLFHLFDKLERMHP